MLKYGITKIQYFKALVFFSILDELNNCIMTIYLNEIF